MVVEMWMEVITTHYLVRLLLEHEDTYQYYGAFRRLLAMWSGGALQSHHMRFHLGVAGAT